MKKMLALVIFLIMLASCCSCLGPVSLDAYGYVISIGVEKGTEKRYYFTFALQRELAEQNIEAEGGAIALCAEGDSIFDAVNEMEGNIPYSLNFSRTNFLIVSRETAEAGELEDIVSTSFDALKIRTSAVLLVTEGQVAEFVGGMYSNNDANVSKLQSALLIDSEKTGSIAAMSVSRLLEACSDGRFDYCTSIGVYNDGIITDMEQKKTESEGKNPLDGIETGDRAGGLKSRIDGAAVFSGWKMAASLDRREVMLLNMVTGEFKNGILTLEYPDGSPAALHLMMKKSRTTSDRDFNLIVEVSLEASMQKKAKTLSEEETDAWITDTVPRLLEEEMNTLYSKLINAHSDAMRFGSELVKLFPAAQAWREFDKWGFLESTAPTFSVRIINTDKYISEDMQ